MTDVFEQTPPEALVRRTAWLDALARGFADDPHRAQDAVQDAWVLALAHRAHVRQLGPWLGRVVRRVAARQRARDTARARCETRAARPEAEPSTLDVVVRVQQQHRVVAAVLALDEPYRTTVLMRFFEGLPPREIARSTGVPVATVRTRLNRAFARLRGTLDDAQSGRRAWALPLLGGMPVPPGAVAVLTGILMKTKLLAGVAVAALGLFAAVLWSSDPERPRTPAPNPGEVATTARTATAAVERAPATATGIEDAPREALGGALPSIPAPDASLPLTGTVVDASGEPIANAVVTALEPLDAGFSLLSGGRTLETRGECTTGAGGRFALTVPFARVERLRVAATGFATRHVEPCYGGEDRTIVLEPGASLTGRITDAATGDPVPGVRLSGFYEANHAERVETVSGADGAFALHDLPTGLLKVDIEPAQYEVQLRRDVTLHAGSMSHLDVALERGGSVFGTVTDADTGLPVAGAEVSAGWTFDKVVRTDGAGTYRMGGAPGPGVPDMHVRADGYSQSSKEVRGDGEQRVDFALRRGGSVRGRIVGPDGNPRAGVYVAADADLGVTNGVGRTDWRHTHSGADGMFRITGLVPGASYALFVRHRGHATLAFHLPGVVEAYRELDAGDVELLPPAVLLGRVVDFGGHGIANARIELTGASDGAGRLLGPMEHDRQLPHHASIREARTGADGSFRLADLAGGSYHLRVRAPDGPSAELAEVRVEPGRTTTGVEVRIDLGRELAGTVVTDDDSPIPLDLLHLWIQPAAADDEDRWVRPERDGSFRVSGLGDGRYRVTAIVSRWANSDPPPWIGSTLEDVAAGRSDLRVVLRRAVDLRGRVVDAEGRPRGGIVVVAVRDGDAGVNARDRTGDDGSFLLRVLPGTVWTLRYGEPLPSSPGLEPIPASAQEYAGARAGATDLVLELR